MKIFTMDNCAHCAEVNFEVAKKAGIEVIDINAEDYKGYVPKQVPIYQSKELELLGPVPINALLDMFKLGCGCDPCTCNKDTK